MCPWPTMHQLPSARSPCGSHTIVCTGVSDVSVTGGILSVACGCTSDDLRKDFGTFNGISDSQGEDGGGGSNNRP